MKPTILLTILLMVSGGIAAAAEVNPLVNGTQIRSTDSGGGDDTLQGTRGE